MKFIKEGNDYVADRADMSDSMYVPYGRISKVKSKWVTLFFHTLGGYQETKFNTLKESKKFIEEEKDKDTAYLVSKGLFYKEDR